MPQFGEPSGALALYASAGTWPAQQNFQVDVSAGLTTLDSNARIKIQQTRSGATQGDPAFVVNDLSQSGIYKHETYFTDNGALFTGRYIVVSQKRFASIGGVNANGALIQGVSALADGSEPSMLAVSPDVDGPAIAAEAQTGNVAGKKNQAALAAYDLDDIIGGSTPNGAGYGRKRFAIRGDGGLWWAADLSNDLWANSDVRLGRAASGVLSMTAPKAADDANLRIDAPAARAAMLSLGPRATPNYLQLVAASAADQGYLLMNSQAIIRFYSAPGSVAGSAISVGGEDDASAIGLFSVKNSHASRKAIVARQKNGQTANLVEVQDFNNALLSGFDKNGYFLTQKNTAPADVDLAANQMAIWFDPTNGASKLMVKAKQADGTVKTASVALA